jgi:hypothetical protein
MLMTLQPHAAAAVVPAAANSVQQSFFPAASSPAPSAVVQPAAAQAAPPPPAVPEYRKCGEWVVTWQVEAEDSKGVTVWRDYNEEFQQRLENEFKQSSGSFQYKPGQTVTFEYNTAKMYQMNLETKKMRLMRRSLVHNEEWLQMDARMQEHAEANGRNWTLTPYYDRVGGKAGGKGGSKGSRSRSSSRRRQ